MKILLNAFIGFILLLGLYFLILTAVSGWNFAQDQFAIYWYFIVSLALGFGIQIGLFTYLKQAIKNMKMSASGSGATVAVTGTTSTLAMISCCAHYLVNILPLLGVSAFVSIVAQYQIELFWVGIAFNLAGIFYISRKIYKFKKQHL